MTHTKAACHTVNDTVYSMATAIKPLTANKNNRVGRIDLHCEQAPR